MPVSEPVETRDPALIREHKAKGGKVEAQEMSGLWGRCMCSPGVPGPIFALHRLLPYQIDEALVEIERLRSLVTRQHAALTKAERALRDQPMQAFQRPAAQHRRAEAITEARAVLAAWRNR